MLPYSGVVIVIVPSGSASLHWILVGMMVLRNVSISACMYDSIANPAAPTYIDPPLEHAGGDFNGD